MSLAFQLCCFLTNQALSQCITAHAGPDQFKCTIPATFTLFGAATTPTSGTVLSYNWTPTTGLSNPNILNPTATVSVPRTYTLTTKGYDLSQNLVVNGNFSAGNSGFNSSYTYKANPLLPANQLLEGQYTVGSVPAPMHVNWMPCGDHTTGTGNMMLINGATVANVNAWCQTVNVTPNTEYAFIAWVASVDPNNPSNVQFKINNIPVGSGNVALSTTCVWVRFFALWNSGANTTANICISNLNIIGMGNDFAIDDIVFAPTCVSTDDVVVTPSLPPSPTISGNAAACVSTPNNITVNGGPYSNISWSTGANTSTINANSAGNYVVTVTNAAGCTAVQNINITQENVNANAGSNITICNGQNANLTASSTTAGATFLWGNGVNVASNSVSPTTTTNYTVTVTSPSGCTQTSTVTVNVVPPPSPSLSDVTICNGSNASLMASGGTSYSWNTGSSSSNLSVSPTTTTSYVVTVSNGTCGVTASATVNVYPAVPTPNITAPTIFCGGSATLTATAGFTYLWSNGSTDQTTTITQSGTYNLTVTDANGCTKTNSVTVPPSNLSVSATNVTICNGQTANLLATSNDASATFVWDNGTSTAANTVTPLFTTSYTVTATTSNGCTKTTTVNVNVIPPPSPSVADLTICAGKIANLAASGGTAYTWNTGSSSPSINVSPSTTTSYVVTVSNGTCGVTASATVNVQAAPSVNITAPLSLCSGVATLTANGTGTYQWSTSATTPSINITQSGTYQVTVTDANGCSATTQATVLAETPPTIVGNLQICSTNGLTTISIAGNYSSYEWNTSATTPSITLSQTGNYQVTVTDANGCKTSQSFSISNYPTSSVSISGNLNVCPNATTVLTASSNNASAYLWSNNVIQNAITIYNPGTYSVTIDDNFGCKSTASVNVLAQPQPSVSILGKNIICAQNGNVTLSTDKSFFTYLWSNNATSPQINVTNSGTFSVTVSDVNGCKATNNFSINTKAVTPQIAGSASFCPGSATLLSVNEPSATSYIWSNGATTATTSINAVGNISVTVTDANGCKGTTNIDVTQKNSLSPAISGKTVICENNLTTFDAGQGFSSYQWSNNETTQKITTSKPGNYTVTVNDGNCSGSASINLLVKPNDIKIALTGDSLICKNATTQIEAQSGFSSYLWSNGNITNTILNISAGLYALTVTDSIGCQATKTVLVKSAPDPKPLITGKDTICLGEMTTFNVQNFKNYLWSSGETTANIEAQKAGIYSITVTDSEGCTGEGAVNLSIQTIEKPVITGDSVFCEGSNKMISVSKDYDIYEWSNGGKTKNINVTQSGFYNVKVASKYCKASDTFYVNVIKNSLKAAMIGDSIICVGDSAKLFAVGADSLTYSWISADKTQTIPGKSFTYINGQKNWTLSVTDKFGCVATTTVKIKENPLPQPTIAGSITIVNNTPTNLDAGAGFSNYVWSNGEQKQIITITQSGTYSVTVTDNNGCKNAAKITLTALQQLPKIVGKNIICNQQNDTLRVNTDFDTYLWSNGSTTPSTVVNQAGVYSVTVTKGTWVGIDAFKVEIKTISAALKSSDFNGFGISCANKQDGSIEITNLNIPKNQASITWNTGDTTFLLKDLPSGTYEAKIRSKEGCIWEQSVTLTAPKPLNLDAFAPPISCKGAKTTNLTIQQLENGVSPFSLSVNNVEKTVNSLPFTFKNLSPGNYKISVTDANGCIATSNIDIKNAIVPSVSLGNDITIYPGEQVQLQATTNLQAAKIFWSNGRNLSCVDCLNPFIKTFESNTYVITVENKEGCEAQDKIKVTVLRNYYVPSVFNPNSENDANKKFSILFGRGIKEIELLRIYDRWGNLVHQTNDNSWDGNYKGQAAQQSVYVFVATIRYLDDTTQQIKGDIMLVWQ